MAGFAVAVSAVDVVGHDGLVRRADADVGGGGVVDVRHAADLGDRRHDGLVGRFWDRRGVFVGPRPTTGD